MNPDDLLEKLQAVDLLRDQPKLKPIRDMIMKELEDYAEEIRNEDKEDSEEVVEPKGDKAKAVPSGEVTRR